MFANKIWLLVLGILFMQPGLAEEGQVELEEDDQGIRFFELKPTFITNFGVSGSGHMRYVKADVTLQVVDISGEKAVSTHLPALRDSIVLLLSRQDESTVSSSAGRETIKAEALQELREILEREEGEGFIEDLLFTNFVVQR